jgi:hypothetical protein
MNCVYCNCDDDDDDDDECNLLIVEGCSCITEINTNY